MKMILSLILATMSLAAAVPVTNPTDDAVTNSMEITQNVIKGN